MVRITVQQPPESFSTLNRLRRVTLGLMALMAVMILGAGYFHLTIDRADALEQTRRRARAVADAGAFHTAHNVGEAYRVLEGLADLYSREVELGTVTERRFHDLMAAKIADLPYVTTSLILRPDGKVLASSRTFPIDTLADPYSVTPVLPRQEAGERFVYQMWSGSDAGGVGRWFLPIGVKARDKDGNVIANIIAMVQASYFAEFLKASLDVGANGAVSLWTAEGQMVASSEGEDPLVGTFVPRIKEMVAQMAAGPDREPVISLIGFQGAEQMTARKLADPLPLAIFVRLTSADYLAPWRETEWRFFVAAGAVVAATLLFSAIILRQLTHTRRNEEALRRAKAVAEEANAAKSRFLAHMSHEFRTPLNAIMGFSDIIKGKVMGNEISQVYATYADHIHRSGEHLLHIVNDVLDMAKIESGAQQIQRSAVDMGQVIANSVAFFEELARQSRITITCDVPEWLPQVSGDERFVRQVLINLLSNAIKFSPAGGTVLLRAAADGRGGLKISVVDGGPGIDTAVLRRIGEPFLQGDPTLSRAGQGTGLGLSICKHYMDLLGGTLEIDSELGSGTTATLRFPPALLIQDGNA